jgi:Rod binding domain-containing protein
MDGYITGIDPLYALGSNINLKKPNAKADPKQEFISIFVSQILKEVFKNQSSMFGEGEDGTQGTFGGFSDNLYNDILVAKISSEIAQSKSLGFDKIMTHMTGMK